MLEGATDELLSDNAFATPMGKIAPRMNPG